MVLSQVYVFAPSDAPGVSSPGTEPDAETDGVSVPFYAGDWDRPEICWEILESGGIVSVWLELL
jgi:hypothetical protein